MARQSTRAGKKKEEKQIVGRGSGMGRGRMPGGGAGEGSGRLATARHGGGGCGSGDTTACVGRKRGGCAWAGLEKGKWAGPNSNREIFDLFKRISKGSDLIQLKDGLSEF
jgi:hypothetical protein